MSNSSIIDEILNNAGITRVIWIDDQFGNNNAEPLMTLRLLKQLRLERGDSPPLVVEEYYKENSDPEEAEDEILSALQVDGDFHDEVRKALNQANDRNELSDEQTNSLTQLFGCKLNCISYDDWIKSGSEILLSSEPTLYLIDMQLQSGASLEEGRTLLEGIIKNKPHAEIHCVLFSKNFESQILCGETHSFTLPDGSSEQYIELSKRAFEGVTADDVSKTGEIARSIRYCIAYNLTVRLTNLIARSFHAGIKSAINGLLENSPEVLDNAIFSRSQAEGAPETDSLIRIISLMGVQQCREDEQNFSSICQQIQVTRSLDLLGSNLPITVAENPFRKYAETEAMQLIGPLKLGFRPLTNGDIFQKTNGTKRYVLLVQPCDLRYRKNSSRGSTPTRSIDIGYFVPIKTINFSDFESDRNKCIQSIIASKIHYIELFRGEGGVLKLDFRATKAVILKTLDLCCVHSEGVVAYKSGQSVPAGLGTIDHCYFNSFLEDASTEDFLHLTLPSNEQGFKPKLNAEAHEISYEWKRISRLNKHLAQESLRALCRACSRTAFDHSLGDDFQVEIDDSDDTLTETLPSS